MLIHKNKWLPFNLLIVGMISCPVSSGSLSNLLQKTQPSQESQVSVISERVTNASEQFLGKPYAHSPSDPLGEGPQGRYDQDPLYRLDTFDCTTFVETTLAAATAETAVDFEDKIKRIRYKDADVRFTSRNHFPSLDWIPNNKWLLDDITQQIAGEATEWAEATIDKNAWYKAMKVNRIQRVLGETQKEVLLLQLQEEGKVYSPQKARLAYLPFSHLYHEDSSQLSTGYRVNQPILDQIPTGAVINIVRPNWNLEKWIGTRMNVSHQGFVIRKNGKLFFRHASSSKKKVVDERFADYFAKYRKSSTAKGINILLPKG